MQNQCHIRSPPPSIRPNRSTTASAPGRDSLARPRRPVDRTRDRTAFCTTNRWARHTVMGGANTNLEKCGATIATWMPHVTVEAGKHIRFSPARTRRSVVHGTALHTGFRSIHWFTSQCDSLKTHVLLATRRSEGGHLSRRHRRRQKLLVARNGAPSLRCGRLQKRTLGRFNLLPNIFYRGMH